MSGRRPLFAGDLVALIGAGLGALLIWAGTGRWPLALVLIGIGLLAIALDLVRIVADGRHAARRWRGYLTALDFDVFALGMLAGAWAAGGAALWLAGALAALGLLVAALGYVFRRRVLAAFMVPGSSPLGIILALAPAIVAVTGGIALIRAYPGAAVPAIVMAVVAFYVLLFAQAALLRVQLPGWQPRPDTRSRQR